LHRHDDAGIFLGQFAAGATSSALIAMNSAGD
jgi:hypothetical protein